MLKKASGGESVAELQKSIEIHWVQTLLLGYPELERSEMVRTISLSPLPFYEWFIDINHGIYDKLSQATIKYIGTFP